MPGRRMCVRPLEGIRRLRRRYLLSHVESNMLREHLRTAGNDVLWRWLLQFGSEMLGGPRLLPVWPIWVWRVLLPVRLRLLRRELLLPRLHGYLRLILSPRF